MHILFRGKKNLKKSGAQTINPPTIVDILYVVSLKSVHLGFLRFLSVLC